MRKGLCLLLLVLIATGIIGGCDVQLSEPKRPPVSFQELCQNKEKFFKEIRLNKFTKGVVIYLHEESRNYFVVTYLPFPKSTEDLTDDQFIVVEGLTEKLSVGDIIEVKGLIERASGEDEEGNYHEVYYVDAQSEPMKIGQVDINDPDFEALVSILQRKVEIDEFIVWWFLYFFFFSPASPASPIYND